MSNPPLCFVLEHCLTVKGALIDYVTESSFKAFTLLALISLLATYPLQAEDVTVGTGPFGFSASSESFPLVGKSLLQDIQCNEKLAEPSCAAVGERGHFLVGSSEAWEQLVLPTQSQLNALSEDWQYAVGEDGIILSYSGGGKTQVVFSDLENDVPLFSILHLSSGTYITVGAYGMCLQGRGTEWSRCTIDPEERHIYDMTQLQDGTIVAVGEVGLIARAEQEGAEFLPIQSPYGGSLFGVIGVTSGDNEHLLAFGLRGTVLMSTDGGKSFQQTENKLERTLLAAVQVADGRVVLVGLGGLLIEFSIAENKIVRQKTVAGRPVLTGIQKVGDTLLLTSDQGLIEFQEWQW